MSNADVCFDKSLETLIIKLGIKKKKYVLVEGVILLIEVGK